MRETPKKSNPTEKAKMNLPGASIIQYLSKRGGPPKRFEVLFGVYPLLARIRLPAAQASR